MDQKPKIREYQGKGIIVQYEVKRCIHFEACIRSLPAVFNQHQRPWIQPGETPAEDIVQAVLRCPTGALHFVRQDGGQDHGLLIGEIAVEPVAHDSEHRLSSTGTVGAWLQALRSQ